MSYDVLEEATTFLGDTVLEVCILADRNRTCPMLFHALMKASADKLIALVVDEDLWGTEGPDPQPGNTADTGERCRAPPAA